MPFASRKNPSSATLALALFTVWSRSIGVHSSCVSLSSSTACPAYSQYYVSLPELSDRYTFLANVTDVESFDKALLDYATSASDYLSPMGCITTETPIPYARYSLTRLCAGLIQDPENSLPCNFQHELTPPPLCQTTCEAWLDSVSAITNDTSLCPNTIERNDTLNTLASQCSDWQGYNGTESQYCISGAVNEPKNCGFYTNNAGACQYCRSNNTDSCCSSVSCDDGLSPGAIAGIVIGSLAAVGLIAFASFCFCTRRKRVRRNDKFRFTTYIAPKDDYLQPNGGRPESASRQALVSHHNRSESNASMPLESSMSNLAPKEEEEEEEDHGQIGSHHQPSLQPRPEDFYIVVHPYPPQMGDELALHVDDIICMALRFDDGWGLGMNIMTGHKGAFPLVCVSPIPREVLDQMMSVPQDDSSKVLIEDEEEDQQQQQATTTAADPQPSKLNLDRLRENVRRSISLNSLNKARGTLPRSELTHHNSIPKRTASMRTTNYGYSEADSPTSPTSHTPFFGGVTPLSNAVVRPRNFEELPKDAYELHDQRHSRQSSSSSTWMASG